MARGSTQATTAATSAGNLGASLEGNASGLYGELAPQLETQVANPQGMGPTELANLRTSNMETAGGSQAGGVGAGGLLAARTRNAGGAQGAIASSARSASKELGGANLKTNLANEQLKERERESGLTGLENLTLGETGAGIQSAGQIAGDVNANTGAENASWDAMKYLLDPLLASGAGYKGVTI